jgi:hypothetical protein
MVPDSLSRPGQIGNGQRPLRQNGHAGLATQFNQPFPYRKADVMARS